MDSPLDWPMFFDTAPGKKRPSISAGYRTARPARRAARRRSHAKRHCWRTHEKRPGVTRPLVHHTFSAQMRRG